MEWDEERKNTHDRAAARSDTCQTGRRDEAPFALIQVFPRRVHQPQMRLDIHIPTAILAIDQYPLSF